MGRLQPLQDEEQGEDHHNSFLTLQHALHDPSCEQGFWHMTQGHEAPQATAHGRHPTHPTQEDLLKPTVTRPTAAEHIFKLNSPSFGQSRTSPPLKGHLGHTVLPEESAHSPK